jgi:hypothetical protein
VQRFSICRKKNLQKLNVSLLVKNRGNFTPQKLTVVRYINRQIKTKTKYPKNQFIKVLTVIPLEDVKECLN